MNLWGRKCFPRPTPPPSWLLLLVSFLKKNERMSFVAIWLDLKIIILSEVSQRQTALISFIYVHGVAKSQTPLSYGTTINT